MPDTKCRFSLAASSAPSSYREQSLDVFLLVDRSQPREAGRREIGVHPQKDSRNKALDLNTIYRFTLPPALGMLETTTGLP
jgi:hypothetical protein